MVRQSMDRLADEYARSAQPVLAACCHLAVSDPMVSLYIHTYACDDDGDVLCYEWLVVVCIV